MQLPQDYINDMAVKGYYVAKGLAAVGDVVAVKLNFPFDRVSALRLNSQDAANAFNNDIDSIGWTVFRKSKEQS